MSAEKISTLVEKQFPQFYREEGENFVSFIKAYYEYMEQSGKSTDALRNIQNYKDIDDTLDEYIQYFRQTIMPDIPQDALADKRLLAKRIKDFYQSKGSIESYKLLFRILYNEDIEIFYPSDQILKISDGDFRVDRYLTSAHDVNNYKLIGRTIRGIESDAEALVEDVKRLSVRGRDLDQILISNIKGNFNNLEPIRIKGDTSANPNSPVVDGGIKQIEIITSGAEYRAGDEVDLISSKKGKFGKAVVTSVSDVGGVVSFFVLDGGSGFTAPNAKGITGFGTQVSIVGGDGVEPASITLTEADLTDTFAVSLNTNLISANNTFGSKAPVITGSGKMDKFANTILGSPHFGFPEPDEAISTGIDFRTNANAVLVVANTVNPSIGTIGTKLFGVTSGANAIVTAVRRAYNSTDIVVSVDTFKKFQTAEKINSGTSTGTTIGTASAFYSNTIGHHVLEIASGSSPVIEGDEIVGMTSGAFGVVKKIVASQANGVTNDVGGADDQYKTTVIVTSNNTSNISTQFDTGPLKRFLSNEPLRKVGVLTAFGNAISTTTNTQIENIYTKLSDSLRFEGNIIGTIKKISSQTGGSGFSIAPTASVIDPNISSLGIGEAYLTLHYDNINWGTGNSNITTLDTNDRLVQANTKASGDVKQRVSAQNYANGIYEMVVRVWQDNLQRGTENINWSNNQFVDLKFFNDALQSDLGGTGVAKIVNVQDEGILGQNATITSSVGANGTITGIRPLDSGFSYKHLEEVTTSSSLRTNNVQAELRLTVTDVANSEGYYATTRSHLSSLRGYIQDSDFYQEYSYRVDAPIAISRYKDIALKVIHPGGQKLFGRFKQHSNVDVNMTTSTINQKIISGNGTIAISNSSFDITGTSTTFTNEYSNGDLIIIKLNNDTYQTKLNVVTNNTTANVVARWAESDITGASVFYISGTIT